MVEYEAVLTRWISPRWRSASGGEWAGSCLRRMVQGLRLEFRVQGEDGEGRKPSLPAYIVEVALTRWISSRVPQPLVGGEGAKENVQGSGVFRIHGGCGEERKVAWPHLLSCPQGGSNVPALIPLICTGNRRIPTSGGTYQRARIRRRDPPLTASGNLNPRPQTSNP